MSVVRRLTNLARGMWISGSHPSSEARRREAALEAELTREADPVPAAMPGPTRSRAAAAAPRSQPAPDADDPPSRPLEYDEYGNVKKTL